MVQDSFSEQSDLPPSLLCFILFMGYLLCRGSNTNCLCFKIISHQAPIYLSEFLHLYTPSRQLHSSTDTLQSPVVSALSLTRLQLFGTNSLFLSAILPLSALLNLPWKPLFKNLFFSLIALIRNWCECVCAVRVRVCVCVHSCSMHWILTNICRERVSA